jgi:predicted phage tail protein
MKKLTNNCIRAVVLGGLLATAGLATAQVTSATTTTSTTSAGTVSTFSPDAITVRTTTSANPVSYTFSKTTTYVDENGNPVSVETVKSGAPVTVFYTQDGDRMVASKVIVRKTVTSDAMAPVIEKKTTTTTTTTGPQ